MSRGKHLVLGALTFTFLIFNSCGRNRAIEMPSPSGQEMEGEVPPGLTLVYGSARFGSQCPFGSYGSPQEVPIELWGCPLGLNSVELNESLQPLILQADCKKKTMDVRGVNRSQQSTTWEMMPDGTFYFSVDGGVARLKQDGAGNQNCQIPLAADMWGKVDCTDRDRAIVHVETIWWLGKSPHQVIGNPMPTSTPRAEPSPGMSTPPFPMPSTQPEINPFPEPRPTPSRLPVHILAPHSVDNPCKVPSGCYFHNITKINQCS